MSSNVQNLHELRPRIIVMGVGGAGGNAVNNMIASGLEGVEFVAANTDAQALSMSSADVRLQIGVNLTEGLGAGSNPEIGESAAEEAMEELKQLLEGAHMLFIACGMGGGTGTGAAPVIARTAQELGVLTVAVVTKPFQFEGQRRLRVADAGIEQLREHVDTMIVIPNQNLFRLANERTTFADSFRLADQVLNSGVACVTDLIMKEGLINLDFADVKTVITEMGAAVMGTGMAEGEGRAQRAAEEAISNPLIDDISLKGAKGLLISISGGQDMTLYEVDEVASRIRQEVDENANIIVGATFDDQLAGYLRVSLVASGLNNAHPQSMHEDAERKRKAAELMLERKALGLTDRLNKVQTAGPPPTGQPHVNPVVQKEPVNPAPQKEQKGRVQIVNQPPRFMQSGVEGANEANVGRVQGQAMEGRVSGGEFVVGAPQAIHRPLRRMPGMDELPITGKKQLQAYEGTQTNHGIVAQKKKVGFFERLAGRNKDHTEPQDQQLAEGQDHHNVQPPVASPLPPQDVEQSDINSEDMTEMRSHVQNNEQRDVNDDVHSGTKNYEKYQSIEINRSKVPDDLALDGDEEIEPIADIPPFLRKTNHNS